MINSDYYTGFEYNANIAKSHKKLFEKLRAENITEAVDVVDDLRLI